MVNTLTGWKGFSKNFNPKDWCGMVYIITEKDTGMVYYGIKTFWQVHKKSPTKYKMKEGKWIKDKKGKRILNTRVNKEHIKKETSWKQYKTSSPIMQEKLTNNLRNYDCRVVKLCKSVTEMKTHEAYLQLCKYIKGNKAEMYNEMINLRIRLR